VYPDPTYCDVCQCEIISFFVNFQPFDKHCARYWPKGCINSDESVPNNFLPCQLWWFMPVIPEVQRLRLEEPEFKASLGYVMTVSKQTNQANEFL
jgi:hypothetical protein